MEYNHSDLTGLFLRSLTSVWWKRVLTHSGLGRGSRCPSPALPYLSPPPGAEWDDERNLEVQFSSPTPDILFISLKLATNPALLPLTAFRAVLELSPAWAPLLPARQPVNGEDGSLDSGGLRLWWNKSWMFIILYYSFSFLLEFYFISLLSCMISFLLCDVFLKTNGLRSEMRRVGPWWERELPTLNLNFEFQIWIYVAHSRGLPHGSVVKNPLANARDESSILGLGRSPGVGNGNPIRYSCLGNPMNRGAWWATVHRVTNSQTLSNWVHRTVKTLRAHSPSWYTRELQRQRSLDNWHSGVMCVSTKAWLVPWDTFRIRETLNRNRSSRLTSLNLQGREANLLTNTAAVIPRCGMLWSSFSLSY